MNSLSNEVRRKLSISLFCTVIALFECELTSIVLVRFSNLVYTVNRLSLTSRIACCVLLRFSELEMLVFSDVLMACWFCRISSEFCSDTFRACLMSLWFSRIVMFWLVNASRRRKMTMTTARTRAANIK